MPLLSTRGAASAFGWIPRGSSTIDGVESTLWSGGSTSGPGGSVIKYTNETLTKGTLYTITIGAANSNSSALSRTATVSSTSSYNNANGTTTTYSTNGSGTTRYSTYWNTSGPYGYARYRNTSQIDTYGGYCGAGGNGFSGYDNFAYNYGGGNGGYGISPTSMSLSGFPSGNVGTGGPGGVNPGSVYTQVQDMGGWPMGDLYVYGANGSSGSGGANSGVGNGAGMSAGSGGFTMRYSNSQPTLTSTTGTVVYLDSGGYHNYFWKSTGSFTV